MGVREVLAENMRRRRRVLEISQEELAHRVGIDRTYVSALERRLYAASIDTVERLATVLGVAPFELLRPAEGPPPDRPSRPRRRGRPVA